MHMKGRRHRLQYKKKVNPELVVEVKPSLRQRKLQEEKLRRQQVRWSNRVYTKVEYQKLYLFFHLFCFCLIFFIKHWLQIIIYTPAAWGDVAAKGGRTSAGGGRAVVLGRTKTVRGGVWVFGLVQTISPRPTRTSAHDASWDASTSIHARNAPYDGMFVC